MNGKHTFVAVVSTWVMVATLFSAQAQSTWRMSVDSLGVEGDQGSQAPSISGDGRFVAFFGRCTNLVAGDTNGEDDVFVRDRQTGTTTRVSVDSAGVQGVNGSRSPDISARGRWVAFESVATNLVPGDTNSTTDVFVHDRETGITTRVSVSTSGIEGDRWSKTAAISADGQFVAFESKATNLVPGDTNGAPDIFVHDRRSGTTTRVSVSGSGLEANGTSFSPSLSGDGRFVAFVSGATNLVPGDTNGGSDVFVRDLLNLTTTRVSVDSSGVQANYHCDASVISEDGNWVAFHSRANNLVSGDTNGWQDVFLHDRVTGTTIRASVDSAGVEGNADSSVPDISASGERVAFTSVSTNLVTLDNNGQRDLFVHDRLSGTTTRQSVDSNGVEGNHYSDQGTISADGRLTAFYSSANNLVPADTNGYVDVFAHGPELVLEAEPDSAAEGDPVTLTTWGGWPTGFTLLMVVEFNGTPFFAALRPLGTFDAAGMRVLSGPVPPGLAGTSATFQALGHVSASEIGMTNKETLTFL